MVTLSTKFGNRSETAAGRVHNGSTTADVTAPANIDGVFRICGDGSVDLYIEDYPSDSDFDHIEVWYGTTSADTKFSGTIGDAVTVGDHSFDSKTVIDGLTNDQAYYFTVKSVDTSGNVSDGYSFSATPRIDTTAPSVTVSPTNGATGISVDLSQIVIDFNEDMIMGPYSYNYNFPKGSSGWIDSDSFAIEIDGPLNYDTTYSIIVNPSDEGSGFIDECGNNATETTVSFTTEAAP